MSSPYAPLPGLLTASWRGVEFHVPDLTTPAGRRVQQVTFPGSDIPAYQDLGLHLGPVAVTGLLGGDDWQGQARALKQAFDQPGPGTLVHPWLGAAQMVLIEPVEIVTRTDQLRVVFFQASFAPFQPGSGLGGGDTLGPLIGAATSLLSLAGALMSRSFSFPMAASRFGDLAARIGGTIASLNGGAALASRGLLPAIPAAPDAASAADWTRATMTAIGQAGAPPATPAIGPGPLGRTSGPVIAPRVATRLLIDLSAAIGAPGPDDAARAQAVSARATALGAAVTPLTAIPYESRQEARRWRTLMVEALDQARIAATIGSAAPDEARAVFAGLTDLKRAVAADIDERIGRLPSVLTVETPARVSAWLIAQHVQGDDPQKLAACYDDLVVRNKLRHPAGAGPGPIETLPR